MNNKLGLKGKLASLLLGAALVLSGMAASLLANPSSKLGSAIGLDSVRASSSQMTVAAGTVTTLRATSTCNARVITTKASPLLLTFFDRDIPTPLFGHLQAASTTVTYTAEEVGCGKVKALSANSAASLVTITETQ